MNFDNIDDSWIEINPDEEIKFYFNESLLTEISKLRKKEKISQQMALKTLDLRRYSQSKIRNAKDKIVLEGLTFFSYYQGIPIIKSVIYLDGKIYHQVNNHYLNHPDLLDNIKASHFWSVEQLLATSKPKNKLNIRINWRNWLPWGIATILVFITVITHLDRFLANVWLWLLVPVALWLLQWGFSRLLPFYSNK